MKIFVTNKCNFNCVYCFKDKRKKEPSFSEIVKQIDNAQEIVEFRGGEPLTRKDILEIIWYAKSRDLKISIETNGLLLNEENLKYIDEVSFVLDTIDFDSWKKITRMSEEDYKTSLKNLMLAKKLNKKITIDALLTKLNLKGLRDLKKFCYNNGFYLRIIENPYVLGFDKSNELIIPINKVKFLGKEIDYIPAKKKLLNKEKLQYYRNKRGLIK